MDPKEKNRAKQVIYEIIRQAGGEFRNKTNMYKAFWKSHLEYAKENPGYLSLWPIVRMPMGPGIDNFDGLIAELMKDELLKLTQVENGKISAFIFSTTNKEPDFPSFSENELRAIRAGVDFVSGKTATSVSKESHVLSRSWREAEDGEELNIYIDLMSDEEYTAKMKKMSRLAEVFKSD